MCGGGHVVWPNVGVKRRGVNTYLVSDYKVWALEMKLITLGFIDAWFLRDYDYEVKVNGETRTSRISLIVAHEDYGVPNMANVLRLMADGAERLRFGVYKTLPGGDNCFIT